MLKSVPLMFVLVVSPAALAADATVENPSGAVETAARRFRIQTYDRYRLQRRIYDARRAAGDEVLEAWRRSGKPDDRRKEVVNWFQQSARIAGFTGLPAAPELPVQEAPVVQSQAAERVDQFSNFTVTPGVAAANNSEQPPFEVTLDSSGVNGSRVLRGICRALFRSAARLSGA